MKELLSSIAHCKNNKSPGNDGLRYEFYKNLHYILNIFNSIMINENIPSSWSPVQLYMLYKKSNSSVTNNYRGICLLNTIDNILTRIYQKDCNSGNRNMKLSRKINLDSAKVGELWTIFLH